MVKYIFTDLALYKDLRKYIATGTRELWVKKGNLITAENYIPYCTLHSIEQQEKLLQEQEKLMQEQEKIMLRMETQQKTMTTLTCAIAILTVAVFVLTGAVVFR